VRKDFLAMCLQFNRKTSSNCFFKVGVEYSHQEQLSLVDIRGGLQERASNESGVVENDDFASFARYIFLTFTYRATIIILNIESLSGFSVTSQFTIDEH